MWPFKFLSFTLKVYVAIIIHLYKIDILKLKAIERNSSLDPSISTIIVATCVASIFSKINLSPHFQSISNFMVYILELAMTIYGTELTIQMIWIPLLNALLWTSTKLGNNVMRSRYKSAADDPTQCIEKNLFCYLNVFFALFVALNTLANFGCFEPIKTLWPFKLIPLLPNKRAMVDAQSNDLTTEKTNADAKAMADAVFITRVRPVRPKKKPILLMNVR